MNHQAAESPRMKLTNKQTIANQLAEQFLKNMHFFKNVMPEIYTKYQDYNPQHIKITVQDDGSIDLINVQLNTLVYNEDPKIYAQRTVTNYVQTPLWQQFNVQKTQMINVDQEAHTKPMNELIECLNQQQDPLERIPLTQNTQLMIMLGVGLGYHIEELLKKTRIRHLVIIEPHEDIFYSNLYTMDWASLSQHYESDDTSLNIIVGRSDNDVISMLSHHIQTIGIYNAARPYIFNHMVSSEMESATKQCFEQLPIIVGTLGYFDDEQVGLTHSIYNIRNKIPFLVEHAFLSKQFESKPVFLIGNGPSLDKAKDFIRENQHKAILISCGSSLSSLYKLGIKPDFHVELERTQPIKEWIETAIPADFRKGIRLLAMNTVHPELASLFDMAGYAIKYNDLGGKYIEQFIGREKNSVTLVSCNPTVANAGMSFSAALGFINLYLMGIDLGYPEGDKHHSELSFHYDIKKENLDELNFNIKTTDNQKVVPGNFGGKVISTPLFFSTKISLEYILQDCKEMRCFNTAHGAAINGAKPIKIDDINTHDWTEFDKTSYCNAIFTKNFSNSHFTKIPNDDAIKKSFQPAIAHLNKMVELFSQPSASYEQAWQKLNTANKALNELAKKDFYSKELLKGSAKSYEFILARSLFSRHAENESLHNFNHLVSFYIRYMHSAIKAISGQFLRCDDKKFNLAGKLTTP